VKIAYIEPAGKGGMIHYAFQLCRALQTAGGDVTLITDENYELAELEHPFRLDRSMSLWDPKPEGRESQAWWAVGFRKLRRIGRAIRYYREWLRVAKRVKELDPDLVLLGDIRFPFDLFPLLRLRRKARVFADICHNVQPFVASGGRSAGLFDRSRWRQFFYRRIYHLFDLVFVHFERNRGEFVQTFGVPEKRVGVIVHGNEEIFRELRAPGSDATSLRERVGLGPDEPAVLFFGTLSRYKGIDVLLDAFPRVLRETRARLVIVGYPTPDFGPGRASGAGPPQRHRRFRGLASGVHLVRRYRRLDGAGLGDRLPLPRDLPERCPARAADVRRPDRGQRHRGDAGRNRARGLRPAGGKRGPRCSRGRADAPPHRPHPRHASRLPRRRRRAGAFFVAGDRRHDHRPFACRAARVSRILGPAVAAGPNVRGVPP
jgi:glycosyltransferase involved in cell wall biosynthesis